MSRDTARRQGQFHSQLASGDLIGQAKGILMARFNITALEAFELLKRLSEDRNAQLVDIARQLTSRMHFSDL
ncbi:MAG TPA: ANTAR domain-containing protein [Mycobacterium sp.]|nr:ANTAR domain-containing protein [Mycobacterium sp.]